MFQGGLSPVLRSMWVRPRRPLMLMSRHLMPSSGRCGRIEIDVAHLADALHVVTEIPPLPLSGPLPFLESYEECSIVRRTMGCDILCRNSRILGSLAVVTAKLTIVPTLVIQRIFGIVVNTLKLVAVGL